MGRQKGFKLSPKHKEIVMKNIAKGVNFRKGEDSRRFGKGSQHTFEAKLKMRETNQRLVSQGKHHLWRGGITPLNQKIRASTEYKLWRRTVFERDSYKCIWCRDSKGGNLEADHIKPFAYFPEL